MSAPPMAVGGAPIIRHIGNELFIVNRVAGNNVTVLDDTTLAFKEQLGTAPARTPRTSPRWAEALRARRSAPRASSC